MTSRSRPARKQKRWTAEEDAVLRDLYPTTPAKVVAARLERPLPAVYARANTFGLHKAPTFLASPASGRTTGLQGRDTRFKKGMTPWNKGTHYTAGGRSAETRFKKGTLNGRAVQLIQPLGAYRVNADGYLDRKVRPDGPPQGRWKAVHRLVWIEAHGPIPTGHVVCFKPGRYTTELEKITPDALELVSRVELMSRNTLHRYPKEIALAIQLRGALVRKINARENA